MSKLVRFLCYTLMVAVGFFSTQECSAQGRNRPVPSTRKSPEMAARRIADILAQPLRRRLEYAPEQLDVVFDEIQEDYGIPIVFDKSALDEVAISPEAEVSISLDEISLRSALNLMFKEPGLEDLCCIIDNEVLLITTEDRANEKLLTRVYRVDDLLSTMPRRFNETRHQEDPGTLINVLLRTVEVNSWAKNSTGDGEVQFYAPGMLLVTQTHFVHEKIESLFDQMRVTNQRIAATSALDESKAVAATQGFVLEVDFGENAEQEKLQLTEALKKSVQWSDSAAGVSDDDVWIKVLPDRLLVRHVPLVLAQVETVLWDMNVLDRHRHSRGGGGIDIVPSTSDAGKPANLDLAEDSAAGDDGS